MTMQIAAFYRFINKDKTPHKVGDVVQINEWHFSSTCQLCDEKITRMFIEGDEDRPDRWTGWGYCRVA